MDILLKPQSKIPIYQQIENSIRNDILTDKLKADELLPSIRQLAYEIKVSVITIKTAYEDLEKENLLYAVPGIGFFVKKIDEKTKDQIKKEIVENAILNQIQPLIKLGISKKEIMQIIDEKLS